MSSVLLQSCLILLSIVALCGCRSRDEGTTGQDPALTRRIEQLVETFMMSDDESKEDAALAEARTIFEREGIPGIAKVGDAQAYGFVFVNSVGQPPDFQRQFLARVREAATRHEVAADALVFAEAHRRQQDAAARFETHAPSHPELRDRIERLYTADQAVREKIGFDLASMEAADRRTAVPLQAILDRYAVPTYDMVGVEAAKHFVVMVQHQPAAFRVAVLPKLSANVALGQADPGTYAMVYDRAQRDQGKPQSFGEQLECATGKTLEVAPLDQPETVDMRRAELGLMRLDLYARLVRAHTPDVCQSR